MIKLVSFVKEKIRCLRVTKQTHKLSESQMCMLPTPVMTLCLKRKESGLFPATHEHLAYPNPVSTSTGIIAQQQRQNIGRLATRGS